ncbi:hypothetical protein SEUCBS140593_005021 [Sporothrix eucalyptigena]|uniref:ferric-chelate reductase (NADPH) n=1 Tax=Sporothrix eucalyptigena TaxID=1812306 RepID=A0ABP0BUQ2_9PEZI
MDMSTPYEWLTSPVQFQSSRVHHCKLTPEQCAYDGRRWVNWYLADLVYARGATWFFLAGIVVFAVAYALGRLLPPSVRRKPIWLRALALTRSLSYPHTRFNALRWSSPSLGVCLLGAAGAAFFLGCVLGPQPYYWPNTPTVHYGDSPPLATRSGYLALGCLPFVLVFGSKANLVTAVTGVAPEKLIIFHLMAAWGMFVLALVHTFPFIVYQASVPGGLTSNWNASAQWLTGVIALLAQAGLTFQSLPFIRHRAYEFFKAVHFTLALVFVVFLFIHCDYTLTSWDYFVVAGALYLSSLLFAVGRTYLKNGLRTARLELVSEHTLKISVEATSKKGRLHWRPGQHAYLRFVTGGVHALTAHPFTICSASESDNAVFYIRPRGGLTGRLAALARKQPNTTVPVFLEGPYGGVPHRWNEGFDSTLVVAGGAGAGFALGLVEDWVHRFHGQQKTLMAVVSSRDPGMRQWFVDALQQISSKYDGLTGVQVVLHVTGAATNANVQETQEVVSDNEKAAAAPVDVSEAAGGSRSASSSAGRLDIVYRQGQADLPSLVRQVSTAGPSGRTHVGVAVCGPSSMAHDVSTACAVEQGRILAGGAGAAEVWLHQEGFTN